MELKTHSKTSIVNKRKALNVTYEMIAFEKKKKVSFREWKKTLLR